MRSARAVTAKGRARPSTSRRPLTSRAAGAAAGAALGLAVEEPGGGAVEPRGPDRVDRGPGRLGGERRARRWRGRAAAASVGQPGLGRGDEVVERGVDHRAAGQRVGPAARRVEAAEAQHLRGIDRRRGRAPAARPAVTDSSAGRAAAGGRGDGRRAGGTGASGRSSRAASATSRRTARLGGVERGGALGAEAEQQVLQPQQPARGDGRRLGVADGAASAPPRARPSPAGSRAPRGRSAARGSAGRRRGGCRGRARGRPPGSRGQMPSLSPPRITSSADCTRASSVPQIAMPGWVTTASSGTSRAAICDCSSARYSSGAERAGRRRPRRPARRGAPAPAAPASSSQSPWPALAAGPGGQRLGGGAVARDMRRERRRAALSASGASAARSQAIQAGRLAAVRLGPGGEVVPVDPGRRRRAARRVLEPGGQAAGARAARRGPLSTSGCLSRTSRSSGRQRRARQRREPAQQHAGRGQRQRPAGAVVGDQPPAVELGGHPARQHPVGRDQRGPHRRPPPPRAAGARSPAPRRAGRAPRPRRGRRRRPPSCRRAPPPSAAPLVGDRRRAQRQRRPARCAPGRAAAPDARRAPRPGRSRARRRAARKPCCGWSAAPGSSAPSRSQTAAGRPASKPGQHQRPLRQPRHRGHEGPRRAARAGRAGDDHRMRRRRARPRPRPAPRRRRAAGPGPRPGRRRRA